MIKQTSKTESYVKSQQVNIIMKALFNTHRIVTQYLTNNNNTSEY